jgi:hypothetical protein
MRALTSRREGSSPSRGNLLQISRGGAKLTPGGASPAPDKFGGVVVFAATVAFDGAVALAGTKCTASAGWSPDRRAHRLCGDSVEAAWANLSRIDGPARVPVIK